MKKGKRIILGAVLTLILLAGAYRLWPRSFESIAGGETGELAEASCFLTVNTLSQAGRTAWAPVGTMTDATWRLSCALQAGRSLSACTLLTGTAGFAGMA